MPQVKTRSEQKEQTRLKLLDSGIDLFAKRGFHSTTMNHIARNSSVSHGTIFLHFPKREDFIISVLDEFGTRLSQAFEEASLRGESLEAVLKAHLCVLEKYENFYSRIVKEEAYLPSSVKSLFFILHAAVSRKLYLIAKEEMKNNKILIIEQDMLFNTWISLVHYYIAHQDLFAPKKSVIKEKGPELIKHFLRLIKI